ncbi:MAG TPA: adenylate/guanylate cyclase domain-containing protein [Acidimicrobiia bacterium]
MGATVTCGRCGRECPTTQRFCGWCGATLDRACPSCGANNPGDSRFCAACGVAVDTWRLPGEERRWVTVVFADLSGFTSASETMDPEDVRAMVSPGLTSLSGIVEQYGGWVNRIIGDAVLAVFGAPRGHEDDAERAVRAALEMQCRVSESPADFGGLRLRVGVNTGEVMFGAVGPDPNLTVMGDVVNTAARLQSAADPGQVLVGIDTHAATRGIRYEPVSDLSVKGKVEPVSAWSALRPLTAPARRPISSAPIVGRQAEFDLLTSIWGRVTRDREPHLVTVLGDAGIGKSMLAREMSRAVEQEGGRVLRAASLPYGEWIPYAAFAQMLKDLAGIYENDDPFNSRIKLQACIERLLPESTDAIREALWLAPQRLDHIAFLAGLQAESEQLDQGALFDAARRFLEAIGREKPTLLIFEDLQWAERSVLDLVEWLAGRVKGVPVCFLALARPELLDNRPRWGSGLASYTALPLGPLKPHDAAALAQLLLADRGDPASVSQVQRTAGGNPLFVEELVAWVYDEREPTARPLPTTVRSIITARLDALPEPQRRLLLEASVIGDVFWAGALSELARGEAATDELLEDLERRDFVRREPSSRIQGDLEFSFKHDLIRDVAYSTVPKAIRQQRHGATAEYLEQSGAGTGGSAAILAVHWREAGDSERAIEYLLAAAEYARRGWAKDEAVRLYSQALELIPPDDHARRKDVSVSRAVARVMFMHAVIQADQLKTPVAHDREGG